ncbi:HK97 gp10 family phage protein [Virgibacillus halodenitrificans]|uniref:HK97-gp10 family putative phage morphogenesis protein n=1 Tax=Virgibacillus halodenitrificans TaxID=1482 RepID=UPI001F20093A|nr:HK97-gp10 family putative phage morphogenesis protein [Virgibacillus halodenitrificans]MCG1029310.1 HK97 gp10 family phage protein [Virgibacillus halodenitrificans]
MSMDMNFQMRNKIDQLGLKGKRLEGKFLKQAGEVLAKGIAEEINRSKGGEGYKHLEDNIVVSNVKTNNYGERSVQVSAIKELGYRLKFLELGTSKMPAQAPIEKGVSLTRDDIRQVLADGQRRIMSL